MNSSRKRVEMSMNTKSSVEPAESYLDVLDENLMRETFELAHQDYLDGKRFRVYTIVAFSFIRTFAP